MPTWWTGDLFAEARREWRWAVKEIAPGVLTQADRSMLELYCELRANIRKSMIRGYIPKPSLIAQVRALASEFGLMPSSRARISVSTPKEEDPLMEWLRGNKNN